MQTYNNTTFTEEQIVTFDKIAFTINKWRGRNVTLLQHPTEQDSVVSIGITFDEKMRVISTEKKTEWATALDYYAHGKVYTSE